MDRRHADKGCGASVKLVFVYNAEAGIVRGFMDSIHKIVSPSSYACDLCAITYGLTSMNRDWRVWLQELKIPTEFFHRAEFKKAWPEANFELPVILMEEKKRLTPVIGAETLAEIKDVDQLIAVLEDRLAKVKHDDPAL
jgi:hypothetical protein